MTAAPAAAAGELWHVTLLVSGDPAPVRQLAGAMAVLRDLDPGNIGVRYRADRAELQFWDEGQDVVEVAIAAAQLWRDGREDAGLTSWALVGLEVLDRPRWRERQAERPTAIAPGSVDRAH